MSTSNFSELVPPATVTGPCFDFVLAILFSPGEYVIKGDTAIVVVAAYFYEALR